MYLAGGAYALSERIVLFVWTLRVPSGSCLSRFQLEFGHAFRPGPNLLYIGGSPIFSEQSLAHTKGEKGQKEIYTVELHS